MSAPLQGDGDIVMGCNLARAKCRIMSQRI